MVYKSYLFDWLSLREPFDHLVLNIHVINLFKSICHEIGGLGIVEMFSPEVRSASESSYASYPGVGDAAALYG